MRGPDVLPHHPPPMMSLPMPPIDASTPALRRPISVNGTRMHPKMFTSSVVSGPSTPICRCRVLYLGSSVPHITKDGLHGIQEPLRDLYPDEGLMGANGIDSWLSVWSNGLLLENVDEKNKKITRFFPIESLHYCAAVRHVCVPRQNPAQPSPSQGAPLPPPPGAPSPPSLALMPIEPAFIHRFLPLDSPFARIPTPNNPPLFACILRRTTGIKVLECHAFVCKKEMAANALVRCCFHAYADNACAKKINSPSHSPSSSSPIYSSVGPRAEVSGNGTPVPGPSSSSRAGSIEQDDVGLTSVTQFEDGSQDEDDDEGDNCTILGPNDGAVEMSTFGTLNGHSGDENHKIWVGSNGNSAMLASGSSGGSGSNNTTLDDQNSIYGDYANSSTLRSIRSVNGTGSTRSGRPRQMSVPNAAPPPPPPPVVSNGGTENDEDDSSASSPSLAGQGRRRRRIHPLGNGPIAVGIPMGVPVHHMNGYPPQMMMGRPPSRHSPQGHYITGPLPPHPPPVLMVAPPMPSPPKSNKKKNSKEEPIYLPTGRPMSPLASFQPNAFPYDHYYLHQMARTLPLPMPHHQKHSKKNGSSIHEVPIANGNGKASRGGPGPMEGGGDPSSSANAGGKFNTGIYRKKGHLNERAFSYSIRQEHRSRSYNSLATLGFSAAPEEGENNHLPPPPPRPLSSRGATERGGVGPVYAPPPLPPPHHSTNGNLNGKILKSSKNGGANNSNSKSQLKLRSKKMNDSTDDDADFGGSSADDSRLSVSKPSNNNHHYNKNGSGDRRQHQHQQQPKRIINNRPKSFVDSPVVVHANGNGHAHSGRR